MKRIILTALLTIIAVAILGQTPTSALIRGRITSVLKGFEDRLSLHYTEPLQTSNFNNVPLQLDSLGRFEVEVPLMGTTPVILVYTQLLLSPGETYDVDYDGAMFRVVVKGRDARLCNEVIAHQPAVCTWDTEWMKTQTDAVVIEEAEKELKRLQTTNDSICRSNPTLSQQWRDYANSRAMASIASYLVQRRYVDASVRQSADGKLWQWLHDHFICQLPHPYTLIQDELSYIIKNYIEELIAPRFRKGFNLRGIDTAISIALEEQADGTISQSEAYADSLRTLRTVLQDYKALMGSGAPDSVLTSHPFSLAIPHYFNGTHLLELLTGGAVGERETLESIERLKDLDMPEDMRDYARAVLLYNEIEQYHAPLRPALQNLVADVRNDYLRGIITSTSSRYQVLAMRSEHEANLMSNEPFKDLTDGKEIFDKIIAPYRGRIVYVDFWGTWCGPCKMDLKNHTHPLHQALSDLPVTYLYLCNGSQTEAWRSTIAEYNLTGEHLVHYNLPAAQQSAVEKYLHVSHFPTYIIFDREGLRVTTEDSEPKPYHPEAVRRTMQEIMNRQ